MVLDHCTEPTQFREYWKSNYGPTIAVYKFNADQPDRVAALDRDFLEFLNAWNQGDQQRAFDPQGVEQRDLVAGQRLPATV